MHTYNGVLAEQVYQFVQKFYWKTKYEIRINSRAIPFYRRRGCRSVGIFWGKDVRFVISQIDEMLIESSFPYKVEIVLKNDFAQSYIENFENEKVEF